MEIRSLAMLALLLTSIMFAPSAFAQGPPDPIGKALVSPANGGNAAEPSTNGAFIVSINKPRNFPTTVNYTVTGTAVADTDYVALTGQVVVPADPEANPSATISVDVIDNFVVEDTRTVIVTLTGTVGGSVDVDPDNDTATVEIASDDVELTLLKTVDNDEGGTAVDTDFTLTATGPVDTITGVEGDASITNAVVQFGTYTLSESAVPDYTNAGWVCTGAQTDGGDGTVTLASPDVATCTVTNTDDTPPPVESATLTLAKTVDNDEGGTAVDTDFTLTATGPVDTITGVEGDASITAATVGVGVYTLTESAVPGYTNAGWVCTGGQTDGGDGTVTLADTDVATCTVTNTDDTPPATATLTLAKTVDNDEGGTAVDTDFTLTATGPVDTITGVEGDASITAATVGVGVYTLTESAVPGYTNAGWVCTGGQTDGGDGTVTLADTDVATCTVTNTDDTPPATATLTLAKTVVNDEGGTAVDTDFTLTATGPVDTITGVEGDGSITGATVGVGVYTLTESAVSNYTNAGWVCTGGQTDGGDGTVTLADSDVATCTVTNTDDTPPAESATLTLAKTVVNDEGGTAVDTDFTLTATGPVDTITGVEGDGSITGATVGVGVYTLTESAVSNYTNAGWVCTGGQTDGGDGTVTLADTDVATCTVTNTDDTPPAESATLTLAKTVVNDEGGTAVDTDFTLTATGPVDTITGVEGDGSITAASVGVGVYTLTESAEPGYTNAGWVCTGAQTDGGDGTVTLADTDVATCTVTNTDDTPGSGALTLNKSANTVTYSAVDDVIFYSYDVTSTGGGPVAGPITVADDKETVTCPAVSTVGNNDANLDPAEELTCTATHTVVQADIDAGSLTNTATASGDAGGTVSNQDMLTVNYVIAALTLDKTADKINFSVTGETITYSYLVTASGGPTPGPITVADDKVTVTCPDVSTVGNNDSNLDPGESITCTASYDTVADDITAGFVTNIATASGNAGGTVSNEDTVTVNYLPPGSPLLTLVKTADPESFTTVGQVINYNYLVSSTGNAPVIGPITVVDSRMTVTCPPVNSVGNNDDNLDVGESLTCTSSTLVTLADTALGYILTISTASGANASSDTVGLSVPFTPLPIPTLSEWSMIVLSFMFLLVGMTYLRRRQLV